MNKRQKLDTSLDTTSSNTLDYSQWRQLFWAVLGNKDLLKLIVSFQHGYKYYDIRNGDWAVLNGHLSLVQERHAFMKFTEKSLDQAVSRRYTSIIRPLLQYIEYYDRSKILFNVTASGDSQMVEYFMDEIRKHQKYAVRGALYQGRIEVIKLLMDNGIKVDDVDLDAAIDSDSVEFVKYLESNGNKFSSKMIDLAVTRNRFELVKYFALTGKCTTQALETAVNNFRLKMVECLVGMGIKWTATSFEIVTHPVVNHTLEGIIKCINDSGANCQFNIRWIDLQLV